VRKSLSKSGMSKRMKKKLDALFRVETIKTKKAGC
jgi:hypothetical protein